MKDAGAVLTELFRYQAWADSQLVVAVNEPVPPFAAIEALFAETAPWKRKPA